MYLDDVYLDVVYQDTSNPECRISHVGVRTQKGLFS